MTRGNQHKQERQVAQAGRLLVRPAPPTEAAPLGLQPLELSRQRDGLLYVPPGYQASQPAPLVLMLHGAGGDAGGGLKPLRQLADAAGLILLAPASRRQTWDVFFGQYGPDLAFIDEALALTFSRYAVDPSRIAVEGFSDGASYALGIGLTNGDLFTHVIAFSPGFVVLEEVHGLPRLFIAHGTRDEILRIERCSRKIVPLVERAGYDVVYREFNGSHTIPPEVARTALAWFAAEE